MDFSCEALSSHRLDIRERNEGGQKKGTWCDGSGYHAKTHLVGTRFATRNKCIATSNKCLTSSNKNATRSKDATSFFYSRIAKKTVSGSQSPEKSALCGRELGARWAAAASVRTYQCFLSTSCTRVFVFFAALSRVLSIFLSANPV